MSRLPRLFAAATLACGLLAVGKAWAVFPPPVKDDGKFFSKEALEKADKRIRSLYEKYHKDVVIETVVSLPEKLAKEAEENPKSKEKVFAKFALDRSRGLGLFGVYVLIAKKPTHLQIHMDPETQKKMFTAANRKTLTEKLVARLKDEEFDGALADGLDAIEAALKANSASK